jgi:pimeloyl-ACP methyl ester carboxylesterase
MSERRVAFLGGNGHGAVRLTACRRHLPAGTALAEVLYPGFAGGGPAPASFDAFLEAVGRDAEALAPDLVYATGIGGLVALALRARGRLEAPLVLQAPVLWGLETRMMPRVMRAFAPVRRALPALMRQPLFRRWFVARHFVEPLPPPLVEGFFAAYDDCRALPRLFEWLTPALLRTLEEAIAAEPARFSDIALWWGGRDHVVPLEDWRRTRRRLGVDWPLRVFAGWGHYPMLEHPAEWAEELAHVATA